MYWGTCKAGPNSGRKRAGTPKPPPPKKAVNCYLHSRSRAASQVPGGGGGRDVVGVEVVGVEVACVEVVGAEMVGGGGLC